MRDEAGQEAVEVGSHVHVRGQFSGGVPGFQFHAEVVEMQVEEDRIQGQINKKIALTTRRDNAARRLVERAPASLLPEAPSKTGGAGRIIAQGTVQFGRREFKKKSSSAASMSRRSTSCSSRKAAWPPARVWVDRQMTDRFFIRTDSVRPANMAHGTGTVNLVSDLDGLVVRWVMLSEVANRNAFGPPRLVWPPENPGRITINRVLFHQVKTYSLEEAAWGPDNVTDTNQVVDLSLTSMLAPQEWEGWMFGIDWNDSYIDSSHTAIESFFRMQSTHVLNFVSATAFRTLAPWPEMRAGHGVRTL